MCEKREGCKLVFTSPGSGCTGSGVRTVKYLDEDLIRPHEYPAYLTKREYQSLHPREAGAWNRYHEELEPQGFPAGFVPEKCSRIDKRVEIYDKCS